MDFTVDNSCTSSNENLILKVPRGQNEYQSQVRNSIQQISSWKDEDESHKQMSNILSSLAEVLNLVALEHKLLF